MLTINTNLSSLIAQKSMKQSTNSLNQAIERMTTGFKINHAKDNAASYNIATNMTTKIGAYDVAEDNALQGLDMLTTASESLELIQEKLRRLRNLQEQASNGTYGEQSLKAINAEANALVEEINRLYNTAEYNGITLFKNVATGAAIPAVASETSVEIPADVGLTSDLTPQHGKFLSAPVTYSDADLATMTSITGVDEYTELVDGQYIISSANDLAKLARMTNAGLISANDEFVLTADINMDEWCAINGDWTVIGDTKDTQFRGIFNGNGHVISKLKKEIFGFSSGRISNLGLENVNITSSSGSLANTINGGLVENCYAEGSVVSTGNYVGGLIGRLGAANVKSSYANVYVKGSKSVGGLIGDITILTANSSSLYASQLVESCYALGNVEGEEEVGGLVGYSDAGPSFSNCYASGDVTATGDKVGGLIGAISPYAYASTKIKNCYASGDVVGKDYVGGLYGYYTRYACNSYLTVSKSYALGNVTGINNVGGVYGYSNNYQSYNSYTGSITKTYALGDVVGNNNVGGFGGYNDQQSTLGGETIQDCVAAGDVRGISNVGGLFGVLSRTSRDTEIASCSASENVTGRTANTVGSFIGQVIVTNDNTNFGTFNISDCNSVNQGGNIGVIGGAYHSNGTLLADYDISVFTNNIVEKMPPPPPDEMLELQVGTTSNDNSIISININLRLNALEELNGIGVDNTIDYLSILDNLLTQVREKEVEFGAAQNRLESVLEEITIKRDNLISSRSTIRDADIAETSSTYIQQQILQQASATLLATANQTPSIALQLI